jgi:uncharacterized protein (TIGR02266 family)
MERRGAPRFRIKIAVDKMEETEIMLILDKDGDSFLYGEEGDISEKGVFVATENPLPVGKNVHLKFSLPDVIELIEAKGRVVWTGIGGPEKKMGMGIEILQMDQKSRTELKKFIRGEK